MPRKSKTALSGDSVGKTLPVAHAVESLVVAELRPHPRNYRGHPEAQIEHIVASLSTHGIYRNVVAAQDGTMLAGHGVIEAARRLGIEEIPGVRLPIAPDSPQALKLLAGDNEIARLADDDDAILLSILRELADEDELLGTGFDEVDVADMLLDADDGGDPPDAPEPEDPPEVPVSKVGEVYELGPHRLMCGDSTDGGVSAVMGDDLADAVWTDPPYGVAVVGGSHAIPPDQRGGKVIAGDADASDLPAKLRAALGAALEASTPGAPWYVAGPVNGEAGAAFVATLFDLGVYRHALAWVKNSPVFSMRLDYHYQHEPIFYGWKPGAAHPWIGGHASTVIEVDRPARSPEHPTMKPVELVERCLRNHYSGDALVLDPFGGSGTTLLAAARLGIRARLVELDPGYCDVIRRRWTAWADEAGIDAGPGALR